MSLTDYICLKDSCQVGNELKCILLKISYFFKLPMFSRTVKAPPASGLLNCKMLNNIFVELSHKSSMVKNLSVKTCFLDHCQ